MDGRVRLRAARPRRAEEIHAAASKAQAAPGVIDVAANDATGSVLIHFDPAVTATDLIRSLLEAGLAVTETRYSGPADEPGPSSGARLVQGGLTRANLRVHRATEGRVDLRLAVPAAFTVLAARQFLRDAGRIRNASWYQLLYWAFDSFEKLHRSAD